MGFLTYGQGLFWFDDFWEFEHLFFLILFKGSQVVPSPESNDVGISSITNLGVVLLHLSLFLLACRHTLTTCHPSPRPAGSALIIHSASGTGVALDKPLEHQA